MKQINDVRSDVQKKKVNLDNAYKTALNEIQTAMTEVIEGLAAEQGFNLAMPNSSAGFCHRWIWILLMKL